MPAVAPSPPGLSVAHLLPLAEAFGDEAQLISAAAEQAARHWEDRAGRLLPETLSEDEAADHESVPLTVVGHARVRYEFAGELEPMPYDWDD